MAAAVAAATSVFTFLHLTRATPYTRRHIRTFITSSLSSSSTKFNITFAPPKPKPKTKPEPAIPIINPNSDSDSNSDSVNLDAEVGDQLYIPWIVRDEKGNLTLQSTPPARLLHEMANASTGKKKKKGKEVASKAATVVPTPEPKHSKAARRFYNENFRDPPQRLSKVLAAAGGYSNFTFMGTEDPNNLPASDNLKRGIENIEVGANGDTSKTTNFEVSESNEPLRESDSDMDLESDPGSQVGVDLTGTPSQVGVELAETVGITEEVTMVDSVIHAENGLLSLPDGNYSSNQTEDQDHVSTQEIGGVKCLSGVKRPRATLDVEQPSVHVVYDSLTRESRKMLEGLLQQWSEWHAKHCSSAQDSRELLESGEETYFPALHVGLEKPSAVTYWVDKQASNNKSEFIPLDGNSIPLYDRGYSFALTATDSSTNVERGIEMVDSSRCFNCGSYGHALKECPKPRDNAAVNSARKQHKSRRNQSASSRNPTRYYQDSPRGKYDGLRPGALDSETRKLLGLGELDPPPWINRMRQMGYPPGYLEDDEDQPSGITIFADEKNKEETEEGEILDKSLPNLPRKMTVDFPGVNAPIPEHADERRWEAAPSSSRYSRSHSHNRYNHAQDYVNRGHYHEQRRSRDFEDDGPPGCDPRTSPSLSTYSYRYGAYDSRYSSHSPRDSASMPRSPSFGRSLSERERRNPIVKEGSYHHSFYGSPR